jgi:hypothetical protein
MIFIFIKTRGNQLAIMNYELGERIRTGTKAV